MLMGARLTAGAAAMAIAALAPVVQSAGSTARSAATAVGIGEREYRIAIYRPQVSPGRVHFNVTNLGEDVHNFVVRSPSGRRVSESLDIRSGANVTLSVLLTKPGRYTLVCTKLDHEARGMVTYLRVKVPKRRSGVRR